MKLFNVFQALYYTQESIILQKEPTNLAAIANMAFLFCAKSSLRKGMTNTLHY